MKGTSEATNVKRGVFLWIMIVSNIVISCQQLLGLFFPSAFVQVDAGGPIWGYAFNVVTFMLEVIGIMAIINWRKWGVYLIAAMELVVTVTALMYSTSRVPIEVRLGVDLGLLALLVWAVNRKWQFFK